MGGLTTAEEDRPDGHALAAAELVQPWESVPVDDLVYVLEHRLEELELVEQLHRGMVLAELVQLLEPVELELVQLVYSQRVYPWRVPPVS